VFERSKGRGLGCAWKGLDGHVTMKISYIGGDSWLLLLLLVVPTSGGASGSKSRRNSGHAHSTPPDSHQPPMSRLPYAATNTPPPAFHPTPVHCRPCVEACLGGLSDTWCC
jgi:hypothetical protein